MRNFKRRVPTLGLCIVELIIGVLLLINPTGFTRAIIILAGLILLAVGLIKAIPYFTNSNEATKSEMISGVVEAVIGLFLILCSGWIISLINLLTTLFGIAVVVVGVSKIAQMRNMSKMGFGNTKVMALSAVVTIICGVLIVINPFDGVSTIWIFLGITLIVEAVLDLIAQYLR